MMVTMLAFANERPVRIVSQWLCPSSERVSRWQTYRIGAIRSNQQVVKDGFTDQKADYSKIHSLPGPSLERQTLIN